MTTRRDFLKTAAGSAISCAVASRPLDRIDREEHYKRLVVDSVESLVDRRVERNLFRLAVLRPGTERVRFYDSFTTSEAGALLRAQIIP